MRFVEKVKKQRFIFLSLCELDDPYRPKTKQNETISVKLKKAWIIFYSFKPGFHMIATIAVIAAIAWEKSAAIGAIIWKPLSSNRSDRSESDHWHRTWSLSLRSLGSGFHMIDVIAELFFFSAIAAIIWKTGLSFFINNSYFFFFVSSFTTSVCTPGFTTSVGVPCDPVQRDWTRNSGNG